MTPQELKNSILQRAIQGKLVEQRPEEGTAEELYLQIQAEKQALIKAGKIKKEKPLLEVAEDEKPFDIPESWMWVRWGQIINIVSSRRVHQSDWKTDGIPFYRAREIAKLAENGYVENELFISQELFDEFSRSGVPQPGDLMVTAVGTLGKTYVVQPDDHFYYKDASVICFENYGKIIPEYLKHLMQSEMMMQQIRSNSGGTTVATLTMVRMVEYLLPLPPLAEQKRIVAKIEELLPLIDRYEAAYTRLEEFNKRFPGDMQKSLLQMAIQSKLVEQRTEEGTGEELFQQIQAEKQALIKSGKIKKDKPLPAITDDEKPFDIPESWKWVRLGDVVNKLTDGSHNPPPNSGTGYPVISAKNVKNGGISFDNVDRYTDRAGFEKENPRTNITRGDLIMGIIGGSIGNLGIYEHDEKVIAQRSIAIMTFMIDTKFALSLLKSSLIQNQLTVSTNGSAQGGVYLGTLKELVVPLPPLAEQKRIVVKLEELLPLCERLK